MAIVCFLTSINITKAMVEASDTWDKTITFADEDAALFTDVVNGDDVEAIFTASGKTLAVEETYSVSNNKLSINPYQTGNWTGITQTTVSSGSTFTGNGNGLTPLIMLKDDVGYVDKLQFTTVLDGQGAHQALLLATSYTDDEVFNGVTIEGDTSLRAYTRVKEGTTIKIEQNTSFKTYSDAELTVAATTKLATGEATVTMEYRLIDTTSYYYVTITDQNNASHYFQMQCSGMMENIGFGAVRDDASITSLSYHVFKGLEGREVSDLTQEEAAYWKVMAQLYPDSFTEEERSALGNLSVGEYDNTLTFNAAMASQFEDKTNQEDILAIYKALGYETTATPVYSFDGKLNIAPYYASNNTGSATVTTGNYTFTTGSGGAYNGLTALIGLKENPGYIDRFEFNCNLSSQSHAATMLVTSYTNESVFDGVAISTANTLRYYTRVLDGNTVTLSQGEGLTVYEDEACTIPATATLSAGLGTVTVELIVRDDTQYYLVEISDGKNSHYFMREITTMLDNFYLGTVRYTTQISGLKYHTFKGPEGVDFGTLTLEDLMQWQTLSEYYPTYFTDEQLADLAETLRSKKVEVFIEAVKNLPTVPTNPTNEELADLIEILADMENDWIALSDDEKEAVTNRNDYQDFKTQVETLLKIKIAEEGIENGGLISFEYGYGSMLEILNGNISSSFEITENPLKDSINTSEHVISFSHARNDLAILALKEDSVGTNALKTFRTKVYLEKNKSHPVIIYSYADSNNWRGLCLTWNGTELICYQARMDAGQYSHAKGAALKTHQPIVKEGVSMGTSDGLWLDVVFEYDITTAEVKFNTPDGLTRLGGYICEMVSSYVTRVGFGTHNTTEKAYFDDISYTFLGTNGTAQAEQFEETYDELLRLRAATVSDIDKEELDAANAEYAGLSEEIKYALPLIDVQLKELTDAYNKHANNMADLEKAEAYWDNGASEYVIQDTFDNTDGSADTSSLGKYVDVHTGEMHKQWGTYYFGASPRIEYSEKMGSNALWIDDTQLTLKEDLLPSKGVHTKVEYDLCLAENYGTTLYWPGIRINTANNIFGQLRSMGPFTERGVLQYQYQPRTDYWQNCMLDPWEPMHVEITVTDAAYTIVITQMYDGDELSYSWTSQESAMNRIFYFGLQGVAGYYDNLSITYVQGDFDVDEEVDYINVLYSGNTVVDGGDVVTLEGENLSANVSRLEVQRVEDNFDADAHGYVEVKNWSTAGVKAGTYSRDPQAALTWNEDNAVAVSVLQRTIDSVKFKLPSEFADGIYAVKLYDFDDNTDDGDLVIYLNAPYIDYTISDEGETALAGGQIQIVGKNMVPDSDEVKNRAEQPKVYMLIGDEFRELTISEIKSDYSLVVDVPLDVEVGKTYEVWLYNGYGDNTCWTIPTTVTIGTDIRETWKKAFINIQDEKYGATGEETQNATAIFIRALEDLYQAGGGTLYLPEGVYRLSQTLIIPENVIITGESRELTNILYRGHRWQENELPDYVFKIQGNVEISNISFYAARIGGFIQFNCLEDKKSAAAENVYIENIKTHFNPYANQVTNGNGDGTRLVGYQELWLIAHEEDTGAMIGKNSFQTSPTNNVQLTDCDLITYGEQQGICIEWGPEGSNFYWQITNTKLEAEWSQGGWEYSRIEDSEGGMTPVGNCLYVDNMTIKDNVDNNRELSVSDMGGGAGERGLQLVEGTECTYKVSESSSNYKGNQGWLNGGISIAEGQGAGQYREIVKVETIDGVGYYTLNEPFYTEINRNSVYKMRVAKKSVYYVDSYLSNGSCGFGYYGDSVDIINDGNTYENVGEQYMMSAGAGACWYFSYVNNVNAYDPYFFHTSVESSYLLIQETVNPTDAAIRGIAIRDNDFGGYFIKVSGGRDVVIQNNWFKGSEYAVCASSEGLYIVGNYYTDIDTPYDNNTLLTLSTINSIGQKRGAIDDTMTPTTLKGDVNCDGVVNIKDVTYVRYYVIGKIELTEQQIENGDMDDDGELTILDAAQIRSKVLESM